MPTFSFSRVRRCHLQIASKATRVFSKQQAKAETRTVRFAEGVKPAVTEDQREGKKDSI
jgi:hypothetical protein